jgi:hypothetical protein
MCGDKRKVTNSWHFSLKKWVNKFKTRSVNRVLELIKDFQKVTNSGLPVALAKGLGEILDHRYVPP